MKKTNLIRFSLVMGEDFTENDCLIIRKMSARGYSVCLKPEFIKKMLNNLGIHSYKHCNAVVHEPLGPVILIQYPPHNQPPVAEVIIETADTMVPQESEEPISTGFEAAESGQSFYYEELGKIAEAKLDEHTAKFVENLLVSANYYSDKKVAEWCIRHEILQRQMRRYAAIHNSPDWRKTAKECYYIKYGLNERGFFVSTIKTCCPSATYPDGIFFENIDDAANFYIDNDEEFIWLANNKPDRF